MTQGSVCRGDSCHVPSFQGTFTRKSAKCEPVQPCPRHLLGAASGREAPEGPAEKRETEQC